MDTGAVSPDSATQPSSLLLGSLSLVVKTVFNPFFIFGGLFGTVLGGSLCWYVFLMPYQRHLAEQQDQIKEWSQMNLQLNQQMQRLAMENREMSQGELKHFVALNQEATTTFMEVQRHLHERGLRMTETPTLYVLIPFGVLAVTGCCILLLFKVLNQRALVTVDQVLHLAPQDLVREVVQRHLVLEAPRATHLLNGPAENAGQ